MQTAMMQKKKYKTLLTGLCFTNKNKLNVDAAHQRRRQMM
jgi:hypothetical protein